MGKLHAQQDWPRLVEAAQKLADTQRSNGEAWRYWGIDGQPANRAGSTGAGA